MIRVARVQGKYIEATAECLRVISFYSMEQPTIDQGRLLEVANLKIQEMITQASSLVLLLGDAVYAPRESVSAYCIPHCERFALVLVRTQNWCVLSKQTRLPHLKTGVQNHICVLSCKRASRIIPKYFSLRQFQYYTRSYRSPKTSCRSYSHSPTLKSVTLTRNLPIRIIFKIVINNRLRSALFIIYRKLPTPPPYCTVPFVYHYFYGRNESRHR